MKKKARVYLGIGSNLKNRKKNIAQALKLIEENADTHIIKTSPVYETNPVGRVSQGKFLNVAVKIETLLTPNKLLKLLKAIEAKLGRKKSKIKWGPRLIDLDILLYNNLVLNRKELSIPHKLMQERYFVLGPLNDIAPKIKHPLHKKTINKLLKELSVLQK
ncbi:MAG: 2-amino-4-hydroxy-6-hydroxymethyldihydropteridine diphosphokinase [Candidatus Omnitrophota bacterium]